MRSTLFLMGLVLFTSVGCANIENLPTDDYARTQEPTVELVQSREPTMETDKPTEQPEEIKPVQDEAGESEVTLVPPSGSVDLGELTPETDNGEDEDMVEAPAPGVPDQQVRLVSLTSQDLSLRLGLDVAEIQLEELREVDWNDGSLGCPAPGGMYIQVITPGYEIILSAGGQSYSYHTDLDDYFVLCQGGRPGGLIEEPFDPYPGSNQ